MKAYERITTSSKYDLARPSHETRYRIAGGFTQSGDVVLDAGCGTGYGKQFIRGTYFGVDKYKGDNIVADLETWQPDFSYDVFIGLEIIEHLKDYSNFVNIAKRAKKWIIISTPLIKTKKANPFHLHDFTIQKIEKLFIDDNWKRYNILIQEVKYGIFIFKKIK